MMLLLLLAGCGADGGEAREGTRNRDGSGALIEGDTLADLTAAVDTGPGELVEEPGEWAAPGERQWTAGVTRVERPDVRMTTLEEVRIARNEGFERVVVEIEGDSLPGYLIEYIDRPVRQCGSGDVVELAGDGWLRIRLEPARAHTEAGRPTIERRRRHPVQRIIREAAITCDFEGQVEWVIGVSTPNRYRVLELRSPTRLVVDIRSD